MSSFSVSPFSTSLSFSSPATETVQTWWSWTLIVITHCPHHHCHGHDHCHQHHNYDDHNDCNDQPLQLSKRGDRGGGTLRDGHGRLLSKMCLQVQPDTHTTGTTGTTRYTYNRYNRYNQIHLQQVQPDTHTTDTGTTHPLFWRWRNIHMFSSFRYEQRNIFVIKVPETVWPIIWNFLKLC